MNYSCKCYFGVSDVNGVNVSLNERQVQNASQIKYPAEKRATIYAIQIVFQLNGEINYSAAGFFSLLTVILFDQ